MPKLSPHRLAPREFRERLGDRIRHLRVAHGLDQQSFAKCLGITQSALSRIETGMSDCTIPRMHHIAETLGIKLTTLLEGLL